MTKPIETNEIRRLAITHLFGRKAQEVTQVELGERSSICDWFVLGTCQSEVQLQSILSGVRRDLRKAGVTALRAEAVPGTHWGVLDFGTVIVHVFMRDAREYFALERLWMDAPQEVLKAEDYPLPESPDQAEADIADESEETWQ